MPTRRSIKGVLQNFLDTFTSRYSDYGGYWLFGIIADDLAGLHIDLLTASIPSIASKPLIFTADLAGAKFREQMQKVGLPLTFVREAHLSVTRSALAVRGKDQLHRAGYDFTFTASVISDRGAPFEAHTTVFVAPHRPTLAFLRSTRGIK